MKRIFSIITLLCCVAACTDDGKYYRDHSEDDGEGSGEVERKTTFVVGSFNLRGDIDSQQACAGHCTNPRQRF